MGEYATIATDDGDYKCVAKLGTCDDWRYTRREEAEAWESKDAGHQTNVKMTLNESGILYRFPFPDEDGQSVEDSEFQARDMFRTVQIRMAKMDGIEHKEMVQSIEPKGGGYHLNVWIPCPRSDAFNLKSSGRGSDIAVVIGERYDADGNGRTIFACGYCGAKFSVDSAEIEELKELNNSRIVERLKSIDQFNTPTDKTTIY